MKLAQNLKGQIKSMARLGRALAVLAVLLVLTVQPAFSQDGAPGANPQMPAAPPMPTWKAFVADAPPYFANMTDRTLAYKSDGTPCVAYGGDALYYSCFNGAIWITEVVDGSPKVGEYASMVFNQNNWPFISYYDAFNGRLKLAYKPGASWTILTVPTPVPVVVLQEPLAERQQASFWERMRALAETSSKGSVLIDLPVPDISFVSLGVGKFTSIDVDIRNWVYISYYSDLDGALWLCLFNGDPFGYPWEFYQIDDHHDQGRVGLWSSLVVEYRDNNNFFVHISYMDEKYDDLKYAYWRGHNRSFSVYTVDSDLHVGSFSSIALLDEDEDPATPVISYLEFIDSNSSTGRLKFAKMLTRTQNETTWDISRLDEDIPKIGWWTSIMVDCGNRIHISYYDVRDSNLKYALFRNKSWAFQTVQSDVGKIGMFTSIANDPSTCLPGIVYFNGHTGTLEFLEREDLNKPNLWTDYTIVNSNGRDVGHATSLALTTNGRPFVSYYDTSNGWMKAALAFGEGFVRYFPYPNKLAGYLSSSQRLWKDEPRIAFYDQDGGDLMWTAWNGINWWIEPIDRTNDVGKYVSMALDSGGASHVSYYDATYGNLYYAYFDTSIPRWITETVDVTGDVGQYNSLVLTAANKPIISYFDATAQSLKYAYKSDTNAWIAKTIDNPLDDSDVGLYTSISLDSAGRPQISYFDDTNDDLKYALWNGVDWEISVLASVGEVGLFTSLKIYPVDNTRHLCYYDYTNGNLMYARWTPTLWEFQVVDGNGPNDFNKGDVGLYCSLDLDATGRPAISYYDNSRGDLRVAASYPLPPGLYYLPITINPP